LDETLKYDLALLSIPTVGSVTLRQLVSYCGSSKDVFSATPNKLLRVPGVGKKTVEVIKEFRDKAPAFAEAEWEKVQKTGVKLLSFRDENYPQRLKSLPDAPVALYQRGPADLDAPRTLSIIGTRRATAYGREVVEEIVRQLAPYAPLIVSGLAYGIDFAAHQAALKHGLSTVAVMATGIDRVYPVQHKKLALQMAEEGALITERPFGSPPDARRFPERNRIIAGLADAVIVVEAGESGGAIITANQANNYQREVFAVPGPVNATYSAGCNALIRQHKAHIYTQPEDIVKALNWDNPSGQTQEIFTPAEKTPLSEAQKQLFDAFGEHNELHLDELAFRANMTTSQATVLFLEMEFAGWVQACPGKRFRKM
jgi:DNA processing protein